MSQTLIAEVRGSVETARTGQESATATLRQQFERMLQRSVLRTSEIVGKRVDQTLAAAAEASAEKMESAQLAAETRCLALLVRACACLRPHIHTTLGCVVVVVEGRFPTYTG